MSYLKILKDDAIKVLCSICQQIWKTQQWSQDWKRSVLIHPKEVQCQRMFKLLDSCTHFSCWQGNAQNHSRQALIVCELRTYRCTTWIQKRQRNQRSICQHLLDHQKSKSSRKKNLLLLYSLCQSLYVDHNKLWKILKEMGIPDHLTCLLRNVYAGQEATVRT